ncbi:winged helix-turn-helix domain-containing protein [Candidatus Omnitrophota bacterium]
MIEKLITSKTRAKLLKFFLTHIDNRYYLRELERMLDESLSPLRRQLVKLTKMGILIIEQEANLKYYRLNRNFAGIEELRRLVLDETVPPESIPPKRQDIQHLVLNNSSSPQKRFKYDVAILTAASFFVLLTAIFVVYTNSKNIRQVAGLISDKTTQIAKTRLQKNIESTRPDEMVSRHWKVLSGSVPALSSGEAGGRKTIKEL